ncbi:DUF1343 domain-containing protein [Mucilaginibacter myungsuensis]|uniref:DUF1343 domain-containing protein n=2 Tax=Mucilaginibacter myungsuensis TaxID=649104 RepID=A0A929L7E2_9SPHI|nr:DUF1343 domain-containing protein [Mucilaginibacter myungsuensis]
MPHLNPVTPSKDDDVYGDGDDLRYSKVPTAKNLMTGADQTWLYIHYLKGKKVGMVINQTSVIGKKNTFSVDSLVSLGVDIKKIFGPEHGFRGNAADGGKVEDTIDPKTGIPALSLYGSRKHKPRPDDLKGLDVLIFDMQDVGARFYTYITTMHYVMEACAENNIELMILDRPNPNGYLVDGGVLDTAFRSSVGMHPIPISHGMTLGEYAQMINGEGWLKGGIKCKIKVIKVANYIHAMRYRLPVNPSPNLSTYQSVILYPSICLFEGTTLSLGRGTQFPFQVAGGPALKGQYQFAFTPQPIAGVSDNPPLKGQTCYGIDLRKYDLEKLFKSGKLNLSWIITLYKQSPDKSKFFNAYFTKLTGSEELRKQIEAGQTEEQIRISWEPKLSQFKLMRKKYLLYK